jgi:hypothetical protein
MAFKADLLLASATCAILAAVPALGQDRGITYTLYGTPGLIDMPSAMAANDGQIAATLGFFQGQQRNSFTFQITPRLSGTFRYASVDDYAGVGTGAYFDRSFDLRYQIRDEGDWTPAVALGLQDFLGTGLYSGEYLVASKTLSDSVRVTGGLGWGRFGSNNGFANPLSFLGSHFETRPALDFGVGGEVSVGQFFRGDAAVFGGIEWAYSDKLTFKAEYSSDAYTREASLGLYDHRSPFNFGVTYSPRPGYQLALSYLGGNEISFGGTILINPGERVFGAGLDTPPPPVVLRGADARAALSWDRVAQPAADVQGQLQQALAAEGISLNALDLTDRTARLRYTNNRYRAEAQAMGRTARIVSRILPPSIEVITLEPMRAGIPLSANTFQRTDIETQENLAGGSAAMQDRDLLADAGPTGTLTPVQDTGSPFSWGLSPYFRLTLFNGDEPVQVDLGAQLSASYQIQPNLIIAGAIRQRLYTNRSNVELVEDDTVPVVRRNAALYAQEGNPGIEYLTIANYGRPAPNLYSRVTLGYLEQMYGGVSAEVLWKPVDSPLAIGVEANYVVQRDFDMGLGFQDYDVVTGHASLYYAFDNGFQAQVDVGRYLAGDWGASFALDREFSNGWKVGAYFTLTDIPFDDYGEGSFDKGIRLSIPLDFILGQPTRTEASTVLRSLTRDGGSRLNVDGRLYDLVRDGHSNELSDGWGRFWR